MYRVILARGEKATVARLVHFCTKGKSLKNNRMKTMLIFAVVLALALTVSAQQCDLNTIVTCTQDYTNMVRFASCMK